MVDVSLVVVPESEVPPKLLALAEDQARQGVTVDPNFRFSGEEEHNYLCGACGNVLFEKVSPFILTGQFARCPKCQAYNRARI